MDIGKLQRALLKWYDKHRRDLPWRVTGRTKPDPYRVLVSEFMLQQTQVATVVEYFERFIRRCATVESLAEVEEQEVLRLWQGLGYYRRARNLWRAAKQIVDQHGGWVPDTVEELMQLPGVGRYTAGAVASIAYGKRAPLLDGNVARVLARVCGIDQPIDAGMTKTMLWGLAERLADTSRPGDVNQAVMELGALVCVPRSPGCDRCPLSGLCVAKARGEAQRLPVRQPRKEPRSVTHHVLALERDGKYLFEQRPDTGMWSGMWQMPTAQGLATSTKPGGLQRWATKQLGVRVLPPHRVGWFVHQTTHRTIRFELWATSVQSGRLRRGAGSWRRLDRLDDLPLANPQRRAVMMLM